MYVILNWFIALSFAQLSFHMNSEINYAYICVCGAIVITLMLRFTSFNKRRFRGREWLTPKKKKRLSEVVFISGFVSFENEKKQIVKC